MLRNSMTKASASLPITSNLRNLSPFFTQVRHKTKNSRAGKVDGQGFTRVGRGPQIAGFPKDTSVNTVSPGEKEDMFQEIGNFSWLGEKPARLEQPIPFGEFNKDSRRVGAVGRKMGTMGLWDARGYRIHLTVVELPKNEVVSVKKYFNGEGKHMATLQVGAGGGDLTKMSKAMICYYRQKGVEPKDKLFEFQVTPDAILPVNTPIFARQFLAGQYVDISGTSRAKGFQGVMKRWGFAGQPASHGCSKTHRHLGSTGMCQDPGRVLPGKKMAGHMGDNKMKVKNLVVYKIDTARNLLFLKGALPGKVGDWVKIEDAGFKPWEITNPPPFPVYQPQPGDEEINELVMDVSHLENVNEYL